MSVPEPTAGESASPKPLDDSSSEEEPSNPAPDDEDTDSDVADQSKVDGDQAPPAESHHTSTADTDDTDASSTADSRDGPLVNDPDRAGTSTPEAPANSSPADRPCGILIRSEIEDLDIIQEPDRACFRPTSYELRLGRECVHVRDRKGGFRQLAAGDSVSLKPFDRLYFETCEILKLPRRVAGRFDLKVGFAIKGLFVQVGTQVEPGYEGRLFGLIINTSSKPVDVFAAERLLTIEFHYLSRAVLEHPKPCYSLRDYLQARRIGESTYAAPSVIGELSRDIKKNRWARDALFGLIGFLLAILGPRIWDYFMEADPGGAREKQVDVQPSSTTPASSADRVSAAPEVHGESQPDQREPNAVPNVPNKDESNNAPN